MARIARNTWRAQIPWESARTQWHYLPNILSYVRILASWIPAYLLVVGFHDPVIRWWAAGTFLFIALTDGIDGWIARVWKMQSEWGAFIDPIADKLLVVVSAVALCWVYSPHRNGWILIGVTMFFVARELILSKQIARVQQKVVQPTFVGKAKTVAQMAMLIAWMLPPLDGLGDALIAVSTNLAIILTLASWIDYYRLYVAPLSDRR